MVMKTAGKLPAKCCGTCQHGQFDLTPTGKFKRNQPGRCTAPLPDLTPILPACVAIPRLGKCAAWPEDGENCPVYALKV